MNISAPLLSLLALILLTLAAIHLGFRPPRLREHHTPAKLGLIFEQHWIRGPRGKRLFAWFLPGDAAAATVLIQHGWGANAELMLPIAQPFAAAGFNILMLDARCHGGSDGDTFASLPRFAEDIEAGIAWLRMRQGPDHPVVLLGHSVGAGAALFVASKRPDITAVISLSAFAHPELLMGRMLKRLPGPLRRAILHYVQWVIGHRFDEIAPIHTICRIECPVLLVHGAADRRVPHTDSVAIHQGCPRANVRLRLIEGADHDSVEKVKEHGEEMTEFLREVQHRLGGVGKA